jgi:SEC-C motif
MGHAHHFLSRLDRVSQEHVELALSLYNDPEMLRAVMAEARAPETAERIAISLDHPVEGPFLMVTREGRFVTCLGEGMRQQCPVVTRTALDQAIERISVLRERREASRRLCPDERAGAKLVERIRTAGENLSREEFMALAAMQPMIWSKLFDWLETDAGILRGSHSLFSKIDFSETYDCDGELLEHWWNASWAVRHLLLLLGLDTPRERFERLPAATLATLHRAFTAHAMPAGLMHVMVAGAWTTARFGDAFAPLCQHRLARAATRADVLENAAALFALGGRSTYYRHAAQRAFVTGPSPAANDGPARELHLFKRACEEAFHATLQRDADRRELDAAIEGARLYLSEHDANARWNGWRTAHDMPLALARVALVNAPATALDERVAPAALLRHIPAIANFRAEDFYLPEALLARVRRPWSALRTRSLALRVMPPSKVVTETPVVGRNEACPCGSSRKYKKCCALTHSSMGVDFRREKKAPAREPGAPSLALTLRRKVA